jgi:hypothetical protein
VNPAAAAICRISEAFSRDPTPNGLRKALRVNLTRDPVANQEIMAFASMCQLLHERAIADAPVGETKLE